MVSLGRLASNGGPGLVEQRGLLKDFHLAADAALGADIGVAGVAPAVRSEIGLGPDERARIGDDVENALVKPLGRNRLVGRICAPPASGAPPPRRFSEWPVNMMIGANGLPFESGCRIICASSRPSKI